MAKPRQKLDSVYKEIVNELNIQGQKRHDLKTDIELIAKAGYYAGASDKSQITDEDILADRVVFASNNFMAINAVVSTAEKRAKNEKILDDAGFEHLITVRFISNAETWADFS